MSRLSTSDSNTEISSSSDLFKREFILNNANSSIIELISGQQAIEKLQEKDDFIKNFSTFDLQSRLGMSSPILQDYFNLIAQHILIWDQTSIQSIIACIENINTNCIDQLKLLTYPSRIFIILTDGKDENNAAYCRNENCIVIPQIMIRSKRICTILIHELFHIWSKWFTNSMIRDELYLSIGYNKMPTDKPVEFPISLSDLKMTNPDAPFMMKYYINLKKKHDRSDKVYKCTPILHACQSFDANFSKNFFHYLVATTLILDDTTYQPLQPIEYLSYDEASNFYDQIGNNTNYIVHPEEILAENFVLWMMATKNASRKLNTPDIIKKMNDIITRAATSQSNNTSS